jgi:hypothetical protein
MGTGIKRSILLKTLPLAALLTACIVAAAPAGAASTGAAGQTHFTPAEGYSHYVEFRAAVNGAYGHSYVAYGRLDSLGRPATAAYADIHPTGDLPSMVLGHFFPMHAATVPGKDTLGYRIARRFRRPITAAEYGRLRPYPRCAPLLERARLQLQRLRGPRGAPWACRRRPPSRCLTTSYRRCRRSMRASGVKYPRCRAPVLRRLSHRRRLDADRTNEPGCCDDCGDLVGWLLTFTPPRQAGRK